MKTAAATAITDGIEINKSVMVTRFPFSFSRSIAISKKTYMSNKSTNENRKIIMAKIKTNPSAVFETGCDGYFFNKNNTKIAEIKKEHDR